LTVAARQKGSSIAPLDSCERTYENISPAPFDERDQERDYAQATESAPKTVPSSYNDFLITPRLRIGAPHSAYLKFPKAAATRAASAQFRACAACTRAAPLKRL